MKIEYDYEVGDLVKLKSSRKIPREFEKRIFLVCEFGIYEREFNELDDLLGYDEVGSVQIPRVYLHEITNNISIWWEHPERFCKVS